MTMLHRLSVVVFCGLLSACERPPEPLLQGENGWQSRVVVQSGGQVATALGSGLLPGLMDGLSVFGGSEELAVFVNHELSPAEGPQYTLANGTVLRGARITRLGFSPDSKLQPHSMALAYERIMDRRGEEVTRAQQINELNDDAPQVASAGLSRLCSAQGVEAGQYNFMDTIHFSGEESSAKYDHPNGGSVWALDVNDKTLWALPELGRGSWENVAPVDTGRDDVVALLLGDDSSGAPLYLWLGNRDVNAEHFLDRNGLRQGQLFVWRADQAVFSPQQFHGTGKRIRGHFVPLAVHNKLLPKAQRDEAGYLKDTALRQWGTNTLGAFRFSRPEDLHTNPANGRQVVFASTGRGKLFPADHWGTLYLIDLDFSRLSRISADLTILYDGDDPAHRDHGIRNPDNLVWAEDGYIYVQEDRATNDEACLQRGQEQADCVFGAGSGRDASVWQLDPTTGSAVAIAEVKRLRQGVDYALPADVQEQRAGTLGAWETSGIVDVSRLLGSSSTHLLLNVQAHTVRGNTFEDSGVVEAGQMLLLKQ